MAVAILGVGIGLSAAAWSVLDGILLRGLPFADGNRIVAVSTGASAAWPSPPEQVERLREASSIFEATAAFVTFNSMVTRPGVGTRGTTASYVTPELFPMLGVEPILGRGLLPEDALPDSPGALVLSHRFWQSRFGGRDDAVGESVVVNREPMTIVGVMPAGFHFPVRQDGWTALRVGGVGERAGQSFLVGRLRPGVTPERAEVELSALLESEGTERIAASEGLGTAAPRVHVQRFVDSVLQPNVREALEIVLWAAIAVLLVACANVANLRLASLVARRHELSLRSVLGARPRRIGLELLAEGALLVVAATLLGLFVSWALIELVSEQLLAGSELLRFFWIDVRLDWRVFLFAVASGGLALLVGGTLPAAWVCLRTSPQLAPRASESRGGCAWCAVSSSSRSRSPSPCWSARVPWCAAPSPSSTASSATTLRT